MPTALGRGDTTSAPVQAIRDETQLGQGSTLTDRLVLLQDSCSQMETFLLTQALFPVQQSKSLLVRQQKPIITLFWKLILSEVISSFS